MLDITQLQENISSYLDVLNSLSEWARDSESEITIRDVRAIWSGIDLAYQNICRLGADCLMAFQLWLEKKYHVSAAGFEKTFADMYGKESLEPFFEELRLFTGSPDAQTAFSILVDNNKKDALKKAYHLDFYEADFYLSLSRLGEMPGLIIGKDSFQQTLNWLLGYNYVFSQRLGRCNSFENDFQIYYSNCYGSELSWKNAIKNNKSDQTAFIAFFSCYRNFVKNEKPDYYAYIKDTSLQSSGC